MQSLSVELLSLSESDSELLSDSLELLLLEHLVEIPEILQVDCCKAMLADAQEVREHEKERKRTETQYQPKHIF